RFGGAGAAKAHHGEASVTAAADTGAFGACPPSWGAVMESPATVEPGACHSAPATCQETTAASAAAGLSDETSITRAGFCLPPGASGASAASSAGTPSPTPPMTRL